VYQSTAKLEDYKGNFNHGQYRFWPRPWNHGHCYQQKSVLVWWPWGMPDTLGWQRTMQWKRWILTW